MKGKGILIMGGSYIDLKTYEGRQKFLHRKEWKKTVAYVLQNEVWCRQCNAEGKLVYATEVDHIISIALRPDLALVIENLQPLCKSCHGKKTAKEMGWGPKKESTTYNKKWNI